MKSQIEFIFNIVNNTLVFDLYEPLIADQLVIEYHSVPMLVADVALVGFREHPETAAVLLEILVFVSELVEDQLAFV
jgi:hypothetical protein